MASANNIVTFPGDVQAAEPRRFMLVGELQRQLSFYPDSYTQRKNIGDGFRALNSRLLDSVSSFTELAFVGAHSVSSLLQGQGYAFRAESEDNKAFVDGAVMDMRRICDMLKFVPLTTICDVQYQDWLYRLSCLFHSIARLFEHANVSDRQCRRVTDMAGELVEDIGWKTGGTCYM